MSTLFFGSLTFVFLYIPIIPLVIYSFNESRLVTVWAGFSVKWYGSLFKNEAVLSAAIKSLKIGAASASLATKLGVIIAYALIRFGRFRGRALLLGLASVPLVIPEVILGISALLMFISLESIIGWGMGRGDLTIIIAHTTFSLAFTTVLIESRMLNLDRSVEEAAADLGGRQPGIFFSITLPIITPALVAGWLLAFILSFDDLVIASFVSGPSSTTLPILIFSKVRLGVSPEINALASLMIFAVLIIVLFIHWITRDIRTHHQNNTR
jgi:putrescine transport system permease protein